jgi:molecular chaperone DnaK (HSP70)
LYRSVIGFGDHERVIGDSAVSQIRSNFKNTLQYVNRYLGLNSECKEQVEEESKYITNKISFSPDKKAVFNVINKGESLDMVPEQIFGAYLKKLKKLFAHEDENIDVVLSVPPYYTTVERQAVLDACKVAKMN